MPWKELSDIHPGYIVTKQCKELSDILYRSLLEAINSLPPQFMQ